MKILIVGCGEIGSRHLQAICSLQQVTRIEVVDPKIESLKLGQQRIREVPTLNPHIQFCWLHSLEEASKSSDLCIVATQASGRVKLIKAVVELGLKAFLIEKTVTQSVSEYEELMVFAKRHQISIWVNCKTRCYPFHKRAKTFFDPKDPIQFSVVGGNHGLAVNGIHIVDLFMFYDESLRLNSAGSQIDPILHPSKRGADVFDLSGSLFAVSDRGSIFSMSFSKDHMAPPFYAVVSKNYRFTVDHWARMAFEAEAKTNWAWRSVPFEESLADLAISQMSKKFVTDILTTGKCELPMLKDCYPAHAFLLNELQPAFAKLLGREINRCPIT